MENRIEMINKTISLLEDLKKTVYEETTDTDKPNLVKMLRNYENMVDTRKELENSIFSTVRAFEKFISDEFIEEAEAIRKLHTLRLISYSRDEHLTYKLHFFPEFTIKTMVYSGGKWNSALVYRLDNLDWDCKIGRFELRSGIYEASKDSAGECISGFDLTEGKVSVEFFCKNILFVFSHLDEIHKELTEKISNILSAKTKNLSNKIAKLSDINSNLSITKNNIGE